MQFGLGLFDRFRVTFRGQTFWKVNLNTEIGEMNLA